MRTSFPAAPCVALFLSVAAVNGCGRTPQQDARTTPARAVVPPDLEKRLGRWKAVPMPFAMEKLSERERRLVEKLIEACRPIEDIFWQQSDPEGAALYNVLTASADPRDKAVRRLLWVNGARFDLLDENRPFVGKAAMLIRIAGQSAYVELAVGLQGAYHRTSLLPSCADHGNRFFITI